MIRLETSHLHDRVSWMNNPSIYNYMHYDVPVKMDATINWFNLIKNDNNRCDFTFFHNEKNVVMGGLTNINKNVSKAELYVFVNPDMQSLGYGKKAVKLLCKYAFYQLSLNKVYLFTDSNNVLANNLYLSIGFVLEGVMRQEVCRDGKYIDRNYYGMLSFELL